MTTKFTASNGVEIETKEDGYLRGEKYSDPGVLYATAGPDGVEALREFFQHERDLELGRWRDPVNPDLVVYRRSDLDDEDGRAVRVLDETTGYEVCYWEKLDQYWKGKDSPTSKTLERYFEAHPELSPWDEAEPGEIWELTGAGGLNQLWVKTEWGLWRSIYASKPTYYDAKGATAGRRIWPEENQS